MISGFSFIVYMGHVPLVALVWFIQVMLSIVDLAANVYTVVVYGC